MKVDVSKEIVFQTARSGGKGGQNVNKVETKVEGSWQIISSTICTEEQKLILLQKLANKVTNDNCIIVTSQIARTQLANKAEVIRKMNELVSKVLTPKIRRIATKPTKASKEKRLEGKSKRSQTKQNRRRDFLI